MAKRKASEVAKAPAVSRRRSARNLQHEAEPTPVEAEERISTPKKKVKREQETASTPRSGRKVKAEDSPRVNLSKLKAETASPVKSETASPRKGGKARTNADKAAELQAKKLKAYSEFANKSPFPDFLHPTREECKLAHKILISLHGERIRPEKVEAPVGAAGCGNSATVLDALVRTILSQNTSDKNSTRAKLNMDKVYGGSDEWEAIAKGGQAKLQKAIESGGLSVVKSKVIIGILQQVKEKYGEYSLDHLFQASDEDAMHEMLSFQGVGPKTASCVLLFCLQRESFAVDTHVQRITGLLGWRPKNASREETHAHLDARIPDEDKYGLHILIINHGKKCEECKAGGKSIGKCELRKAFRGGKIDGQAGEAMKKDEIEHIKEEDPEIETDQDAVAHAIEQLS